MTSREFKPLPPYLLIKVTKAEIPSDIVLTETQKKELMSKKFGTIIKTYDGEKEFKSGYRCFFEDFSGQDIDIFKDEGEFIILDRKDVRAYLHPDHIQTGPKVTGTPL